MRLSRVSSGRKWRIRPDGRDKVSGRLKYLTDLKMEGMLYGRVLRSEHAHARILSIRTEAAEMMPGVRAVITHQDVPGMNLFGIATPDQPVLCDRYVRYTGDAIAAVAADSPQIAAAALQQITVEYEPLEPITSPEQALEPNALQLHPNGNVLHRTEVKRGEAEEAFAVCAHIVEETYYTPRQMHGYMETEGGLFVPEPDGRLTVYAATQHGYKDRMQLARILGMPEENIRVISSPIGGSFGGKDELNVQPYGVLLAIKSGRPVHIHNSRAESVRAGLKRHPMKIEMKTGADPQGRIIAHRVRITADTGAYATLGAPVLNFATEHCMGPYVIPHLDVEGISVYTNNGVSGEFRGFGGNQAIFAMEGQMDRLAALLGMDPWVYRLLNMREAGDPGPLEQEIVHTDGLAQVYEAISSSSLWQRRDSGDLQESLPWIRRGVGAAVAMHGAGLGYGIPDPAGGRLSLTPEGLIEAAFSYEEFGQGLIGTLEIMLCDLFSCDRKDLSIVIGDTDRVPHSGSSTASRSTTMAWMALQRLKPMFLSKVLGIASRLTGQPSMELTTGIHGVYAKSVSGVRPLLSYRQIAEAADEPLVFDTQFEYPTTPDNVVGGHYLYTYAAVAVEVEVNTISGEVKLLDTLHAVAAGPVINPMGYIGQIEGGSLMALGFTLTEDAVMREGLYATTNLDTYLMPTIKDIHTRLEIEAIEDLPDGDSFGPRGIGEVGSVALAPAITSAVHHATGMWLNKLPIERERLIQPLFEQDEERRHFV
ncbi:xanthine dehydrogenase subunit D [Paenibacillus sp. JX-17]|uniref:Xanthine dehydrogenase subunit D n=1 Tax=Paenibacillus lacisoli TaxID=3064525 RepID=A0ABT9CDA8_9BACL|nr:xanthine dehydrogenase subunit D [Paenibacillus sp. JX-17]MDO7905578.1 xanthine dehydrogenase subunit D [Paenibacillus sp. JX-17]